MSLGIDYGGGLVNRDKTNGIRYGVISQHSVSQAWADSAEPEYGDPTCPECGNKAIDLSDTEAEATLPGESEDWKRARGEDAEYACKNCEYLFGSESAFGDDPQGYVFTEDGYEACDCLDSDIMITKSPFFTFAPFCGPCVPGAGNLDGALTPAEMTELVSLRVVKTLEDVVPGVKSYCFGHDWFEDGIAPYSVYGVISGRECFPDDWYGGAWSYAQEYRRPLDAADNDE